jgi:hypothetical protein
MATPESKVKAQVKKILDEFGDLIDGFWPVPSGYGESHLDYVGCCNGIFFCIETKAPGKKPTPRQIERARRVTIAKGHVFVIDGTEKTTTYVELRTHLMLLAGWKHGKTNT